MRRLFILMIFVSFGLIAAAPATQPSRDALARARAEAEAMIQSSGPLRGSPVAFEPAPPRANLFAREYQRYTYSPPSFFYPYRYGYGGYCGFGFGFGWGFGFGRSGGASYQNSSGGVGW
jgi:hypothetical protein